MRVRLEKDGAAVPLEGEPFAHGGEAAIWAPTAFSGLLAKIYHEPTPEQADKLTAMIAAPPDDPTAKQGHTSIAWPTQRLLHDDGRCVGFVMPRVDKAVSLFNVYNPKSRLQTWPLFHYGYLLLTARNLAIAVRALHARGYVLGDLNESNVLVNVQAPVTVVDTDSFQVRAGQRTYRCIVGKPEYIAPEIQGADFKDIDRTPEQDNFALAVLIFQLLMQGTHPFAGRFMGEGEPEVPARRIAAGHWPYGRNRHGPYEPNPTAPPFVVLPFPLRELMRQTFEDGHDRPSSRPNASDWYKALTQADGELTECVANAQHHFHRSLDACPWCELATRQGRDPFPSREQLKSRTETAVPKSATISSADLVILAPAPTKPPARPVRVVRPRKPPPAWLRMVLTPWPWAIGAGAIGLVVLVWLIASNGRGTAGPRGDLSVPNPSHPGDDAGQGAEVRTPLPKDDGPFLKDHIGEMLLFKGHDKTVNSIALSSDGRLAITGGWDGSLRLWDARTGDELSPINADPDEIFSVAISPEGRFALTGGLDHVVHLWNLESGAEVRAFLGHTDQVHCVAFSPNGSRALSGGYDQSLRWWNVETGELLQTFSNHGGWVTSAAFSPDGSRAVSGCTDHLVRVWDLDRASDPIELTGHENPVHAVAFAPDGARIASGDADGMIRIWNVDTGAPLKAFPAHDGPVRSLAFTPDGRGLLSGGDDGMIR